MPLTEKDPNVSGRSSRASNLSTGSRGPRKPHSHGGKSDLLSTAPGVLSMLRTSTELGDVGGLAYDSSSVPSNMPRGVPRRSGASSRMSTASSHSTASRRTSSHQPWPPASSGARRSMTRENNVPQYVPDTLSPTIMNLPGSSPLIPRSQSSKHGSGRSFSLTHTSHPSFGLSNNRSFASLRTQEHGHRPRSPYQYPTRLRRPGYRPSSPALSDVTGARPRRQHGRSGHQKLRIPSDISIRYEEGRLPGHANHTRAPNFSTFRPGDVPPVPALTHRMVVEQSRLARKLAQGSVSSGSTNRQTNSDAPSSDGQSPPTSKDGSSMEVLVSSTSTRMLMEDVVEPLFYDYTEQFERDEYIESPEDTVPTGFVHHIKTILEEKVNVEQTPRKAKDPPMERIAEPPNADVVEIAELPGSPVARRITRDMVLAALDTASSTEDAEASTKPECCNASNASSIATQGQLSEVEVIRARPTHRSPPLENVSTNRYSVLSQVGSSVMDSSTLDFAVRYSIPMATGSEPNPADTDDGMSDLLAGYQRTESGPNTKHDSESPAELQATTFPTQPELEDGIDRKSNHAAKSSDEQSFKSCTELPDEVRNDTDAKSGQTCQDAVTPERSMSLSASRLPSNGSLAKSKKRPVSEIPLSSPMTVVRRLHTSPPRESSCPQLRTRTRASSKVGSQESMVASTSPFVERPGQLPPPVPPRESSSSKEAQRSQAVADFLLRLSRPRRFSKSQSANGKQAHSLGSATQIDPVLQENTLATSDPRHASSEALSGSSPIHTTVPETKVTPGPYVAAKPETSGLAATQHRDTPKKDPEVLSTTKPKMAEEMRRHVSPHHRRSLSSPSPRTAARSSVCTPHDPPPRARFQSSPGPLPAPPAQSRRDSQTTTHIVWHGQNSSTSSRPQFGETPINRGFHEEDSTTDLRLSAYRYPASLHHLPDLKEESHEDSSLNTSASNLKNSTFRLPVGAQITRLSVDDAALFGPRPSSKSVPKNNRKHSRGLPSMNFSHIDLFAKLNEALDMRTSRSLEGRREDILDPTFAASTPKRQSSAGEIREKYRSFFASLDELEKTTNATQAATILDMMPLEPPYSPDELVAEIDKLTIPSVGGLTQRLSELIPSLREYYRLERAGEFAAEEVIMEHALEEIHEVGGPALKRSSARLRPMPGSPNLVVIDDGLYDELTGKETDTNSPSSGFVTNSDASVTGGAQVKGIANARARDKAPLVELEPPSPALIRARSLSLDHQDLHPSLESRLSSRRRSLHSPASTPTATDTRPWNSDKNYPWATTIASIDISLPARARLRDSPRPRPSPLRRRFSDSSEISTPAAGDTPASPTTILRLSSSGDPFTHSRHRLSFFSSNKRATNTQATGFDASGFATGPLLVRGANQPHEAGERYPSSALTPPPNANLSQHRSHWSEDTTEDEMPAINAKKLKLSNLKGHFTKGAGRGQSSQAPQAQDNSVTMAPNDSVAGFDSIQDQEGEAQAFTHQRNTFGGAKGMSTTKFHGKRFLKMIRSLMDKAGRFTRKMSKRNRVAVAPRSKFRQGAEEEPRRSGLDRDDKPMGPGDISRGPTPPPKTPPPVPPKELSPPMPVGHTPSPPVKIKVTPCSPAF
ncbi:hypothetical protein EJ04DRAFT_567171 [Polyplosphaeria fusca]|uniref:Uncharacterized protein n=1 Tax=Polyplosphaeria fusca TaxID=682080 RepID=A0A9P4QU89_9PLEO|nr:hypothetical protein EJ04DRAFT_567171 [Polyplosphaeria fusca]